MSEAIIRAQLRKGLIQLGAPAEEADLVLDVAVYALEQAVSTIDRICATIPAPAALTARAITLQLFEGAVAGLVEQTAAKMQGFSNLRSAEIIVDTRQ